MTAHRSTNAESILVSPVTSVVSLMTTVTVQQSRQLPKGVHYPQRAVQSRSNPPYIPLSWISVKLN